MQPALSERRDHFTSTVLTDNPLPVLPRWLRKRSETTRTNEEEDLVFKYSAIRASSNGQESPACIHCRYGPPHLRKLYVFIPRLFPSIILLDVVVVTPVLSRMLISLLTLRRKVQKIIERIVKEMRTDNIRL